MLSNQTTVSFKSQRALKDNVRKTETAEVRETFFMRMMARLPSVIMASLQLAICRTNVEKAFNEQKPTYERKSTLLLK